jgi:hypothetical protein
MGGYGKPFRLISNLLLHKVDQMIEFTLDSSSVPSEELF